MEESGDSDVGRSEPGSRELRRQAKATTNFDVSDMTMGLVGGQNALRTWVGHRTYTMTARHWACGTVRAKDTAENLLRKMSDSGLGTTTVEYGPDIIHI